jgi:hypothetical protein
VLVLLVVATLGAFVACGSSRVATPSEETSDAAADASAIDAVSATDAPPPLLPYPPGPYGGAVGDTMPDFTIFGYPLTRTDRDSTKLPFRPVSLSEMRSLNPSCDCLAVIWDAAGLDCPFCGIIEYTMSATVEADPSICAIEVLGFNYDATMPTFVRQPVTRSDIDERTQSAHQPFPVGLPTDSALRALSGGAIPGVPSSFVVRPRDMRILGFHEGSDLVDHLPSYCHTAPDPTEILATGLESRRIVVDGSGVYMTDAVRGLLAVSLDDDAGNPISTKDSRPGDLLAADGDAIYYVTTNASAGSTIVRYDKTRVTTSDIATSTATVLAIAVDADALYLARADGVVGRLAKTGGQPVTALVSGVPLAPALTIDADNVYYARTDTADIWVVPKAGGAAALYYPAVMGPGFRFDPVDLVHDGTYLRFVGAAPDPQLRWVYTIPPGGLGAPINHLNGYQVGFGLASDGTIVFGRRDFTAPGSGVIMSAHGDQWHTLTPGVPLVHAVAADAPRGGFAAQRKRYVYFTTESTADGAHDGTLRRSEW